MYESTVSADHAGCPRGPGWGRAAAAGHRIFWLSRRVGVDRDGYGDASRLDSGILRAADDEACWHLFAGRPRGKNGRTTLSDFGLRVPIECDTIGCRCRM